MARYEDGWPPPPMTRSGLVYIPHLREWRTWEYDLTEWPFVPLNYEPQTDEERASLGRLDRYDCESDEEYAQRKRMRDLARRYGKYFLEIPMEDEPEEQPYWRYDKSRPKACESLPTGRTPHQQYHEEARETFMRDRARDGWWDIDNQKGKIRPIAKVVEFDIAEFPPKATLAHVMHKAKLFESIGEARKNGWNKPLVPGLFVVGKEKRRVLVKEPAKEETHPKRTGWQLVCHARFQSLTPDAPPEELVFSRFEQFENDPIGDWGVWCRKWNGQGWGYFWQWQGSCRKSDVLRTAGKAALYSVRAPRPDPNKKNEFLIETYYDHVQRFDQKNNLGFMAVQVERSRAMIENRPVRKFLDCAVRYV